EDGPLGIDVFAALVGAHRPAAEGDDPAPAVLYRDDQAVPEPVEEAPVAAAFEAGRNGFLVRIGLLPEVPYKSVPAVRRVAQAELFDRFGQDPALGEVPGDLLAALGAAERLPEVEVRGVVGGEETLLALL